MLVKAAARPHHLEVGVTGQSAQTPAELGERGLMNRLNRHAQRDAKNDGNE